MKIIDQVIKLVVAKGKLSSAPGKRGTAPAQSFQKPTITPLGFIGDVVSIVTEGSTFNKVWVKRELDPRFRETLMLAVARMNDSKYCSWAHHEWAMIEGVDKADLAYIEKFDPAHFDARTALALNFVRELVAARFGPVARALMQKMREQFSAEEIEEITLVAKVMDFANRSSNTFDALISRVSGKPSRDGRLIDEALMSAAFLCALPPIVTYFAKASGSPVTAVLGRMRDYTTKMDYESMVAAEAKKASPVKRKRTAPVRKPSTRQASAANLARD